LYDTLQSSAVEDVALELPLGNVVVRNETIDEDFLGVALQSQQDEIVD
jgi:hypothetical protein